MVKRGTNANKAIREIYKPTSERGEGFVSPGRSCSEQLLFRVAFPVTKVHIGKKKKKVVLRSRAVSSPYPVRTCENGLK